MLFVGTGQQCTSQRAEAHACCCKRNYPLGPEVKSGGVEIWFYFAGSEREALVTFSDDKRSLFFCPKLPWHDAFLAIWIIKIGV